MWSQHLLERGSEGPWPALSLSCKVRALCGFVSGGLPGVSRGCADLGCPHALHTEAPSCPQYGIRDPPRSCPGSRRQVRAFKQHWVPPPQPVQAATTRTPPGPSPSPFYFGRCTRGVRLGPWAALGGRGNLEPSPSPTHTAWDRPGSPPGSPFPGAGPFLGAPVHPRCLELGAAGAGALPGPPCNDGPSVAWAGVSEGSRAGLFWQAGGSSCAHEGL